MSEEQRRAELALDVGAELGEGPVWDERSQELVFLDIAARRLHRFSPSTGAHDTVSTSATVGSVILGSEGGLVLAAGVHLVAADRDGSMREELAGPLGDERLVRLNDGKADPSGRIVVGTMHHDERDPVAGLYLLDEDRHLVQLLEGITISNGLAWSQDGGRLFYIDSPTRSVDVFDVDRETGMLDGRRQLVDTAPFVPDGMAIDDEGCLWVALFDGGRVERFDEDGRHIASVVVPEGSVTSVTFGGEHLDQLYITTARHGLSPEARAQQPHAGDLFTCTPGVTGPAPHRFRVAPPLALPTH